VRSGTSNAYNVELGYQDKGKKDDTEPGAPNSSKSLEREFFKRVALRFPRCPKSNAGKKMGLVTATFSREHWTYWQRQMASHVNIVDRPDNATSHVTVEIINSRSHVKSIHDLQTVSPAATTFTYASGAKLKTNITDQRGRLDLSTL
jgi:hypothetical protein